MHITLSAVAPTAGGASISDIVTATGIAAVYFAITGWLLVRERTGHRTLLGRALDTIGEKIGLPAWAAGPFVVMPFVLLTAGFGVYWDVPVHMQRGRDAGAFTNPGHYPIYLVLLALLNIGIVIMAMAKDPLPRRTLALAPGWKVPYSSVILSLAGLIAVIGFPLDDLWHRIFGQDVTEWGPTHVLMIGGAITSPLCLPLLLAEAKQAGARLMAGPKARWVMALAIALCIVPFAFLMEFDLGVPQFPASTQGLIFCFVMVWTCVANRLWFGRGGALLVCALWWFAHLFLVAVISALPHVLTVDFLTAVPVAVIVELVALALHVDQRRDRVVPAALLSGLVAGSLGYYLEWLWSRHHMPVPQPFHAHVLPFLIAVSTVGGLLGGMLAVWHVRRLQEAAGDVEPGSSVPLLGRPFKYAGLVALLGFVALMGVFAPPVSSAPQPLKITFSGVTTGGSECTGERHCLAYVTATFPGKDPVPDAAWFYALAWQGYPNHGTEPVDRIPKDPTGHEPGVVRSALLPTGTPGQYRTQYRIPLYGHWKAMVRIHQVPNTMMAWALHLPDDPAIASARGRAVQVHQGQTVHSIYEPSLLQRERKDSIPGWVYAAGNYVVMSLWVLVLLGFGWCYNRAAGNAQPDLPIREKVST